MSLDEIRVMQEEVKSLLVLSDKIYMKYQGKMADMTGQEETEWQNTIARADMLTARIETVKKADRVAKWAAESSSDGLPMGGAMLSRTGPDTQEGVDVKAIRGAWKKYIKGGMMVLTPAEVKAYQADNPVGGGFLVAPQDFVREIITLVKDQVFVRQLATVFTVNQAESLGIPAIDTDPSDADWTAELLTGGTESTMAFGKRELRPHPLAKNLQVSNKLLRNSAIDAESVVMDRMAYKFAVTEEKAFLSGTGANQPLGVFTASSQGISTARDVTAATTTAVAADDFISTKYKLKAQYQGRAAWIMHRDVVAATRKLKDQNNNYLWTTGLTAFGGATGPGNGLQGTPERLLDCPIMMSEYAPNTFTTALYMAVLGDWKNYYIADSLDMQWQVLDQRYAELNQTGYIGRREMDGIKSVSHSSVIWN